MLTEFVMSNCEILYAITGWGVWYLIEDNCLYFLYLLLHEKRIRRLCIEDAKNIMNV
jgi:hypothetical protein